MGNATTRISVAVVATVALVVAPLLAATPALAADGDYVGVVTQGGPWPDGTLAVFLDGESYTDSLQAPFDYDDRDHGVAFDIDGDLPDGISAEVHGGDANHVYFSGTPGSVGAFSFSVVWYGTEGAFAEIQFTGSVESTKADSATALSITSPVAAYDDITLTATVTSAGAPTDIPTGSVEFWTDPATWGSSVKVGTSVLDGAGVASFTWASMSVSDVGAPRGFIAKYLGDDVYASEDSAVELTLPYVPTAEGVVRLNGQPVEGAVVRLLDGDDPALELDSDTTDVAGEFALDPGAVATVADAQKLYYVQATLPDTTVLYFTVAGTPNVGDIDDAGQTGPLVWTASLTIDGTVPPVWSDTLLAAMRVDSVYADAVAATSPTAVTYSVSAGSLPAGLLLGSSSGAVTGTPTCALEPCTYSFEITATNVGGSIQHTFTGTLLPAGVAPTWDDDELDDDLQVSVPVDDGVTAVGDPTILYAVASGSLPSGLTLSTTTGAITGTPTTAGDYTFQVSAANDFGTIFVDFDRTVAAAPDLDLTLNFAAGTSIDDATTQISADGLKVGSMYTLTMFSTPVVLYTGVIGPTGGFTWTVALPANTPPGAHQLVLNGIAPNGTAMTARAWFVLLPNGTIGAISYTGPLSAAQLAYSGVDPAGPLGLASALVVLGLVGVAANRRRNDKGTLPSR